MKDLTEAERRERAIEVQASLKGGRRNSSSVRRPVDPLEQYLTPHGRALLDQQAYEASRAYKREQRKATKAAKKAERRASMESVDVEASEGEVAPEAQAD
jgi:hypothetical protein